MNNINEDLSKKMRAGLVVLIVLALGYLGYSFRGEDVDTQGAPNEEENSMVEDVYTDENGQPRVESVLANDISLGVTQEMGGVDYTLVRALKFNPVNSDITERTILDIMEPKDLSFGILPDGYKSGLIFEIELANNGEGEVITKVEDLVSVTHIDGEANEFDVFLYGLGAGRLAPGQMDKGYIAFAIPVDAVSTRILIGGEKSLQLSFLEDSYGVK